MVIVMGREFMNTRLVWLVQVVRFSRSQAEAVDAPVCRVSLPSRKKEHRY